MSDREKKATETRRTARDRGEGERMRRRRRLGDVLRLAAKQCLLSSGAAVAAAAANGLAGKKEGRREGRKSMYKNVLIHKRLRLLLVTLFRGDLPPYHFSLRSSPPSRHHLPAFYCLAGFFEIVVLNRRVTGAVCACNAARPSECTHARTHERLSRACPHVNVKDITPRAWRNVDENFFSFLFSSDATTARFPSKNGNEISRLLTLHKYP